LAKSQDTQVIFGQGSSVTPWTPKELPVTRRGIKTRDALVAAARVVFERDGFINSRLTDITAEAHCSTGTFYHYFESKEEALVAVLDSVQDDMMHPGLPHVPDDQASIRSVISASNRAYLEAYRRNARLMLLLEQVATLDPLFADLRLARSRTFAERNVQKIVTLQEAGLADRSLDPAMTSWALSSMISRLAYFALVLGETFDFDELVETVTTLWLNALRISDSNLTDSGSGAKDVSPSHTQDTDRPSKAGGRRSR
jgi:AcrR family transcriptional regulator